MGSKRHERHRERRKLPATSNMATDQNSLQVKEGGVKSGDEKQGEKCEA